MIHLTTPENDIKELRKLEEKAKHQRLSNEEIQRVLTYVFALGRIPDEIYWNEMSV